MNAPPERRARTRLPVRWRLRILPANGSGETLEATTENLSSRGFYCWITRGFAPGEIVRCLIELPGHAGAHRRLWLRCEAEVVRSECGPEAGLFGLACRIREYEILVRDMA